MIPPVDPSVLEAYPNFARLHSRLTTTLLAPDASTRAKNLTHAKTTAALEQHQISLTKNEIVKRGLHDLVGVADPDNGNVLPAPLRELIYTIWLYISEGPAMNLDSEDLQLIGPEVEDFLTHLPEISQALSSHIDRQHAILLDIACKPVPSQSRSGRQPSKPTLQESTAALQPQAPTHQLDKTFNTLLSLLSTQSTLLMAQITNLERHTHGTLSRHSLARAAHLRAVADALALKTRVMYLSTLKATYTNDTQAALTNCQRYLRDETRRVQEREDVLSRIVAEYDGVRLERDESEHGGRQASLDGGGVMRQVGQKYGEILKEIEDVESDLRNLTDEFTSNRARK